MCNTAELKQKLLAVAKESFAGGLFAGTSGNLSALDTGTGTVIITPSSVRYEEMTIGDLVVLRPDGTVVEGKHKPSSEWRMHCMVYRNRDDVFSVFHTHSPYATAFAVIRKKIPLILIEMIPFLGGDIPVAEPALPGSDDMGISALEVLNDRNACLLSNHGVLTIGRTVEQARIRAEYTEDAAKIYHYALAAGDVNLVPEAMAEEMRQRLKQRK